MEKDNSHTLPPSQTAWIGDEKDTVSFQSLAEETTLHGINRAANTKYSKIRRACWLLVLLLMMGLCIRALTEGVVKYISFPSNTKFSVESHSDVKPFVITLCSNNKLKMPYSHPQGNTPGALEWYTEYQPVIYKSDLPDIISPQLSQWLNETDAVTFYRQGMPTLPEDFLYLCKFGHNEWLGGCGSLLDVVHTEEGLCYSLDPTKHFPNWTIEEPGDAAGIRLHLLTTSYEYGGQADTQGVGIKVMVHEPGQFPPRSQVIHAGPATEVHVGITKTTRRRLGRPWSKEECQEELNVPHYTVSSVYTKEACQMECFYRAVHSRCNCDMAGTHDTLKNCSMYAHHKCIPEAKEYARRSCKCLRPCEESIYHTDVTYMKGWSDYYLKYIEETYETYGGKEAIEQELVKVIIYMKSLDEEVVEQQKAYTEVDFLADVGGQMGLFLGASIITISEFLEFIVVLIAARCQAKSKVASSSSTKLQKF